MKYVTGMLSAFPNITDFAARYLFADRVTIHDNNWFTHANVSVGDMIPTSRYKVPRCI